MAFGDLCALVDVKAWLNLSATTDDALLSRLVTAASQYIQKWLNRPIPLADYIETRDGLGGPLGPCESRFVFGVQPCAAVASVMLLGTAVPPLPANEMGFGASGGNAGYLFSASQLVIRGFLVPRQAGSVVFQYTAGYAAIPPDLEQAAIELAALRYRERQRIGDVSRRIGSEVVAYSQKDMTDAIRTLIQQYRLVAPAFARMPELAPTATDPAILAGAA